MGRGAKAKNSGGGDRSSGGGAAAKKQKKDNDDEKIATQKTNESTLEELIDAVSDDDEDDDDEDYDEEGDEDEDDDDDDAGEGGGDGEDEKRALALRKMIRDGKFDELLKPKASGANEEDEDDDDDDEEEDEDDDEDEEEDDEGKDDAEADDGSPANEHKDKTNEEDDDDEDSSSDEDEDKNNNRKGHHNDTSNSASVRSLALHTSALSSDRHLPWPESFAVTAVTPLPFTSESTTTTTTSANKKSAARETDDYEEEMDTGDGGGVDVHDDLAREVAFYDTALECTTLAREQCEKYGIPFARPEDFFAEMVKSDGELLVFVAGGVGFIISPILHVAAFYHTLKSCRPLFLTISCSLDQHKIQYRSHGQNQRSSHLRNQEDGCSTTS